MPKKATTKRTNDPGGMRARVLDAAAHAFQQQGYARTSMHDLQREAAISTGALYHHFPTKKDLALAVIKERVAAEVNQTWVRIVRDANSAASGILEVFESTIAQLDAVGRVTGCPLGNLATELSPADEDLRSAIATEYQVWRRAVAERLSAEIAEGRAAYAAADADAFATVVVALFSGAMSIAKAEQKSTALRACVPVLQGMMDAGGLTDHAP